jgi:hypothetical protein
MRASGSDWTCKRPPGQGNWSRRTGDLIAPVRSVSTRDRSMRSLRRSLELSLRPVPLQVNRCADIRFLQLGIGLRADCRSRAFLRKFRGYTMR